VSVAAVGLLSFDANDTRGVVSHAFLLVLRRSFTLSPSVVVHIE
jgi:hypothetical protein